jgi:flagellin
MISIQTNVTSLMAQQNLNIDNEFQNKTIDQLTSGYRINSSGDDAAGLAIANGYRSNVTELNQGVLNANDGISQLQIVDGGLNNISTILDRLQTLATESASSTFTGSRATLNQEYSELLTEVTRQASNVNLNVGGAFNNLLSVYIGGATQQSNATVSVDLSGADSAVDATSLGLANTNVLDGGAGITGNSQIVNGPGATFVKGTAGVNDQSFTFNVFSNGNAQTVTATVAASAAGSSLTSVLSSLNGQLNQYGITAGTASDGTLQFSGASAFTMQDNGATNGSNLLTNESTITGSTVYTAPPAGSTLTLTNASGTSAVVTFAASDNTVAKAIAKINAQTSTTGISAESNAAGTGINLVGAGAFTAVNSAGAGVFSPNGKVTGTATSAAAAGDTITLTSAAGVASTVTLKAADVTSVANTIAAINAQAGSSGVSAVLNSAGTGINFVGNGAFTVGANNAHVTTAATTTATEDFASDGVATINGATTGTFVAGNAGNTIVTTDANGNASTYTEVAGDTSAATLAANINAQYATDGIKSITAVVNSAGTGINFVGEGAFNVTTDAADVFAAASNLTAAPSSTYTAQTSGSSTLDGALAFTTPTNGSTLTLTSANNVTATVTFSASDNLASAMAKINAQTATTGISAVLNATGTGINLVGSGAFTAKNSAANGVFGSLTAATTSTSTLAASPNIENTANYTLNGATTFNQQTGNETLQFQTSNGAATVTLAAGDNAQTAVSKINAQTASLGVYAVLNSAGTGISLQGQNSFSLTDTNPQANTGFFSNTTTTAQNVTATAPAGGSTNNATAAISAINNAIQALGLVQGRVGAGENLMQYAVTLAQSQISSFSAAESQLRDADIAAQAANLTKAQVLTQTSVAALAQANSAPQAVLKLLQG